MDPTQQKMSATPLRALLLMACLLGLQVASGCGRVRAGGTGSETHWLVSCGSDLECDEGACECGVCSQTCVTTADCGAFGISGVECLPTAGACDSGGVSGGGSSAVADGSVCLLPCARDLDCLELGSEARCENQRCELPPGSSVVGGSSGAGNLGGSGGANPRTGGEGGQTANGGGAGNAGLEIPTLCDGSEEMRVVYASTGGFTSFYYDFVASYGHRFFAIDGQCRFWQGRALDGGVYSGSLTEQAAQAFARALGFGHLSEHSLVQDYACDDGPSQVLWTLEGRISCTCSCGDNPDAPAGWRAAFNAVFEAQENLFAGGQIVTGPAQLALLPMDGPPMEPGVRGWPFERAPRATEIIATESVNGGLPRLDESSGALISNPEELSVLRELRVAYSTLNERTGSTPLAWTNPDTDVVQGFYMLLRDEAPATVKQALETARTAP